MKKEYINALIYALVGSILVNLIYIGFKNILGCMNYDLSFYISIIISMIIVFIIDFKVSKKITHSLLFCLTLNIFNFLMIYILEMIPYPLSNIVFICDNSGWFNGFAYAMYFMFNTLGIILATILSRITYFIKNKNKK